ncbi:MAG: hypothetical protein GY822_23330 [Deltaproteobacteria bacterium]|nr:hypothetical protein [Deltaproteobacteria bacterium]
MTFSLGIEQAEMLSAALRHIRDAEHLASIGEHRSEDQAWHLVGFGPECIRKACLQDNAVFQALGHGFDATSEEILTYAISLDAHAARYQLENVTTTIPELLSWSPQARYKATGVHTGEPVHSLVARAKELINRIHAELWADGRVMGDDL